jgi:hypothetical protein
MFLCSTLLVGILMRTAVKKTVFLSLSASVLLAGTSLSHAGFIWLAPDGQTAESTASAPYAAKPAPAAEASDRNWAVAESVPAIPQAAAMPAQPAAVVPAPQTLVAPPEAVAAASESVTSVVPAVEVPAVEAPVAEVVAPEVVVPEVVVPAMAAPKALLSNETMAAEPIYGKGEKKPEKLVELAAPAVEPVAVESVAVAPVAAEPAAFVAAPMVAEAPVAMAPAVEQPLVAASQADARVAAQAPAVTANVGMPNAQRMIDAMPSAVAQAPAPVVAPAEPAAVIEAPVAAAPVEPVVLSPRVDAAPVAPQSVESQPAAQPEAVLASASVAPTAPEPASAAVAPVSLITGDSFGAAAPAPAPTAAPAVVSEPAPAPATEVVAPVVQGFGTRVPLVIALRQILPSGYSFAHGDGVDLGASVDWKGGKPWVDVLTDTLAPAGLKASVSGETVFIQKADEAAPAAAVVPATSSVAPAAGAVKAVLGGGSMIQSLDPAAR